MKVARTVLNGESGSNAADLHNNGAVDPDESVTRLPGGIGGQDFKSLVFYFSQVLGNGS